MPQHTSHMGIVLTVGSINMDIVARCSRAPEQGETLIGDSLSFHPGGKGANQAIAAARSGADSRLVGSVGQDRYGLEMLDHLRARGVGLDAVAQDPSAATGVALITVDAGGANRIVVVPGANQQVPVSPGLCAGMDGASLVALAQFETNLDAIEAVFEQVQAVGGLTLLNPSPLRELPASLVARTSGLIVNEIEFGQLFGVVLDGGPVPDRVLDGLRVLDTGRHIVVVTLGRQGCVVKTAEGRCEHIAGHSAEAVDTTGAGDCFAGALAAELAAGSDLFAAARYATAAAAISVTRLGAGTSAPTRAEVLALIAHSVATDPGHRRRPLTTTKRAP